MHQRFRERLASLDRVSPVDGTGVDNGGGPPHDGDMEARVAKLEEFVIDSRDRLTKIESRLDQTSTKADLHENANSMIKWIVGSVLGLGAAAITVMTFVLNNATPKAPAAQPAPIIITVPQQGIPAITTPAPAPNP